MQDDQALLLNSLYGLQFDKVMTSYKKHSRQWSSVYNKFAEGSLFDASSCCFTGRTAVPVLKLACSAHERTQASYGGLKLV